MLPTLREGELTLRPLDDHDLTALVAVVAAPGVAEWWSPFRGEASRREELASQGRAFAIAVGGTLAGWLGFEEENEPDFRHASLDIFLAPAHQGLGLGPAALRLAARWLVDDRGHHRLTIDPAADNDRAIRAYGRVGFRPVGTMRRYERRGDGRWSDNLLMDVLAEEL